MSDFTLTTPIAFFIFNRPHTTARVFSSIARVKPRRLLVVADGPRVDREGETERVAQTREILNLVDWPCEVETNFSDINLGCKARVSSGVDWVFERVDEAIFLEDDCLPDQTFFRFCQEMLERYRGDPRIGMISGGNFLFGHRQSADSYYFSKYVHIWGWACWRDRWVSSYDVDMKRWPAIRDGNHVANLVGSRREARRWRDIFEFTYRGAIDTWDYQWIFANWLMGRLNIVPSVNLISNIGFGPDATHTTRRRRVADLATEPMEFPLRHPVETLRNLALDARTHRNLFGSSLHHKLQQWFAQVFAQKTNELHLIEKERVIQELLLTVRDLRQSLREHDAMTSDQKARHTRQSTADV